MDNAIIDNHMKNEALIETFKNIFNLFNSNGFSLHMVGGSVRDYLLGIETDDLDVVSNATPEEMKSFVPGGDYTFARFGSVRIHFNNIKVDITTLRKETSYSDSRHPSKIEFCDSLLEDVKRRDFTINGLYLDHNLQVIDYVNGQSDLHLKVIKMIGDPDVRLKEDPLRIVRAFRFQIEFDFALDQDLEKSIVKNKNLLKKINPEKIKEELQKSKDEKKLLEYLNDLCNL